MKYNRQTSKYLALLALLVVQIGCDLKTPPSEVPKPKDSRFHKSFFVQWDAEKKVETGKKTFLCGNSFLSAWGRYREFMINNNNNMRNCNNVFEITKNELIAKHVNPALPGAYDEWIPIMSFRITHYNVEKSRDGYGRETNKTIETAQYDDWRNQEYLEIDFSSMRIIDFAGFLAEVDGVKDRDFDKEAGFMGFTANVNSQVFAGSQFHGALRVNFLEMPKTEGFEPSPYHKVISKYANVLDVMGGQRPSGDIFTVMGKWNTKKKNKFYVNNFPEEYEHVAFDVIKDWNDAFEKIGHGRPFEAVKGEDDLIFDLRKPSITWINERRLRKGGLLGIAQNTADVTTGEMHWGAVSIWVDFLKALIDNSITSEAFSSGGDNAFEHSVQTGFLHKSFQKQMRLSPLVDLNSSTVSETTDVIASHYSHEIERAQENLVLLRKSFVAKDDGKKELTEEEAALAERFPELKGFKREDYVQLAQYTQRALTKDIPLNLQREYINFAKGSKQAEDYFSQYTMQDLIGQPSMEETISYFKESFHGKELQKFDAQSVIEKVMEEMNSHSGHDCHRTAFDYASALGHLKKEFKDSKYLDKDQIFKVILKLLISHEMGHVVGLGHNFKENIMPEKGTVPAAIYDDLAKKHQKDMTNISTVMGYPASRTEILLKYEEVKPFIGDYHTLELIYNQKYPMYTKNGDGTDCFDKKDCYKWKKLEHDGKMLESVEEDGKKLSVGYLPFCTNGDQFIGDDPYCQPGSRGSSAVELIDNYISDFSDYVSTGLYNIANDLSTRPFYVEENFLWMRSLSAFGRMRTFHDYMRREYDKEIFKIGESSVDDSYYTEFSEACELAYKDKIEDIKQETLKELFESKKKDKRFVELCYANKKAIEYIGSLISLSGKDYTVVDYDNRSFRWQQIEGQDDVDINQAYGTWHSLARVPLKFSALYALTLPYAFTAQSWRGIVFPSPVLTYAREDARFHYSVLYPKEYNKSLTDGVIANLHFGDDGEDPYIGRSILALGYLQSMLRDSNDTLSIRGPYKDLLLSQAQFRMSRALIQVDKVSNEEDEKLAKKFNASLNEYWGRGSTKLKNFFFYTDNQVVLDPPVRTLIYPLGSVNWFSATTGMMGAFKITYDFDRNKLLSENSLKSQLTQRLNYLMKNCIEGVGENKNGLKHYFNDANTGDDAFKGFNFSLRIMDNEDQFYYSIAEEYKKYYDSVFPENPPKRGTCDKAIKAQNLLVSAAGLLNGVYFPEAFELIEKGL